MTSKVERLKKIAYLLNKAMRFRIRVERRRREKEANKSVRGMPRLSEATKDVVSCEKLRGDASDLRSADVRMGKPAMLKT